MPQRDFNPGHPIKWDILLPLEIRTQIYEYMLSNVRTPSRSIPGLALPSILQINKETRAFAQKYFILLHPLFKQYHSPCTYNHHQIPPFLNLHSLQLKHEDIMSEDLDNQFDACGCKGGHGNQEIYKLPSILASTAPSVLSNIKNITIFNVQPFSRRFFERRRAHDTECLILWLRNLEEITVLFGDRGHWVKDEELMENKRKIEEWFVWVKENCKVGCEFGANVEVKRTLPTVKVGRWIQETDLEWEDEKDKARTKWATKRGKMVRRAKKMRVKELKDEKRKIEERGEDYWKEEF